MPNLFSFIVRSLSLGTGLAMDAFSVSVADGLREGNMSRPRAAFIAGIYGLFQFSMPLIGWGCIKLLEETFTAFQPFIPWIALGLLLFLGGKMIWEGCHAREEAVCGEGRAPLKTLLLQGLATSIDALSVGFTIASYTWSMALGAAGLIGAVTFLLCLLGLRLGRFLGSRVLRQSCIIGGVILIAVGLEIFLSHIL